jgi:activator of HSP90 ATPase
MTLAFEVSTEIPASPGEIYRAWLSSEGHAAMTGSPADVSGEVGGSFLAWGGYISGTNLSLEPDKKIVQSWRTTEFEPSDDDSHLTIVLEDTASGTRVTLTHTNLPEHGMQYKQGWEDNYFSPMRLLFNL